MRMTADTTLTHALRTRPSELTLPQRPEVTATYTEKVQALLAFCERAIELQTTLRFQPSHQAPDFSTFISLLNDMKPRSEGDLATPPTAASMRSPEAVATELATLATAQLSSQLVGERLGYWLAVMSALSAATRTTMPNVSREVEEAQTTILKLRAESPSYYREARPTVSAEE